MSKSPSKRGNDLHVLRRQALTPANGTLRRMAELVLHDRVELVKEKHVIGLGFKNPAKRRFTEKEILTMRRRYRDGERICNLAREFHVHQRNMAMIVNGDSYAWVTE